MTRWLVARLVCAVIVAIPAVALAQGQPAPAATPKPLDFATYRDRVQPLFLDKREGLARCYVCHSQGTPFRLQRLSAGRQTWNDEETRKNFEAIQRLVVKGQPDASRLLLMPLAHDAGGTEFHPGGKRWANKKDAEWQALATWVKMP